MLLEVQFKLLIADVILRINSGINNQETGHKNAEEIHHRNKLSCKNTLFSHKFILSGFKKRGIFEKIKHYYIYTMRIILSRTDAIGDVTLTLPMAGILKKLIPGCEIFFIGKSYTRAVIQLSEHVDHFVNFDDLTTVENASLALKALKADCIIHVFPNKLLAHAARKASIKIRIGTTHRFFHFYTCNKLINLGRKNSSLHESQLNIRLLEGLGYKPDIPLNKIHDFFGLTKIPELPLKFSTLPAKSKFNLILHPTSNASAREWPPDSYSKLIHTLDPEKFQIFITGQKQVSESINQWLKQLPGTIIDCTGQMSLEELISFIDACDGLIACSTGPLHIAAALNKKVIGLYPPIKPMHSGRWGALGLHVVNLSRNISCNACIKSPQACICMAEISVQEVVRQVMIFSRESQKTGQV